MSHLDMRSCKEPEPHLCIFNRDPESEPPKLISTHDVMSTPDKLRNILEVNVYEVSVGDTQGTYLLVIIILVSFELAWKHDIFPMGLVTARRDLTHTFLLFQPSGRVALLRSETVNGASFGLYTNSRVGLESIKVEAVCTMWSTIVGNALKA